MRYSLEGTIDKTVLAEFTTPSRRTSQQLTVYTGVPTFKNQCRIHRVLRARANARHTRYTRSKIKRRYATVSRERLEEKRTNGVRAIDTLRRKKLRLLTKLHASGPPHRAPLFCQSSLDHLSHGNILRRCGKRECYKRKENFHSSRYLPRLSTPFSFSIRLDSLARDSKFPMERPTTYSATDIEEASVFETRYNEVNADKNDTPLCQRRQSWCGPRKGGCETEMKPRRNPGARAHQNHPRNTRKQPGRTNTTPRPSPLSSLQDYHDEDDNDAPASIFPLSRSFVLLRLLSRSSSCRLVAKHLLYEFKSSQFYERYFFVVFKRRILLCNSVDFTIYLFFSLTRNLDRSIRPLTSGL